jgi:hypothetical protein
VIELVQSKFKNECGIIYCLSRYSGKHFNSHYEDFCLCQVRVKEEGWGGVAFFPEKLCYG